MMQAECTSRARSTGTHHCSSIACNSPMRARRSRAAQVSSSAHTTSLHVIPRGDIGGVMPAPRASTAAQFSLRTARTKPSMRTVIRITYKMAAQLSELAL